MRGTVVIMFPDGGSQATHYERPLTLPELKDAIGGGYIEVVPGFVSWADRRSGKRVKCVAFCDEEGIRKGLPVNLIATVLWRRQPNLQYVPNDLLGQVAVVFGDDEFMAEL
jgi:hypothetical protein